MERIYLSNFPFLLLLISFLADKYSANFLIGASIEAIAAYSVLEEDNLQSTFTSFKVS
jgi:hypothetical protein